MAILRYIPTPVKRMLRPVYYLLFPHKRPHTSKYASELAYWRDQYQLNNRSFPNAYYRKRMLGMAQQDDESFLAGKIVADFGCGPQGSLVWATPALLRIGIDVLVDRYADEFTNAILLHGMVYVKSTESVIPIPDNYIDILYTLNAIDHVDNFTSMCDEMRRILKPGGDFIGSFNLEEPPTVGEPQRLTEEIIHEVLLRHFEILSYRLTRQDTSQPDYQAFFDDTLEYTSGESGYLWVRARKPTAVP